MTTLLNKIGPKRTDLDGKVIETEYYCTGFEVTFFHLVFM